MNKTFLHERLGAVVQISLLLLGMLLIGLGLARGEAGEILQRAIFICLECIGLG